MGVTYYLLLTASTLAVGYLTYLYHKLRKSYGTLEKLGIPVIKPFLCFGSDPKIFRSLQQTDDLKRMKKYGKIWALYEGVCPQIYIADNNLVGQVLHMDFNTFPGPRKLFNFHHPMAHEALPQIQGEKWIALREELNKFFVLSELGGMRVLMKQCTSRFMQHLKKTISPVKPYVLKSLYEGVALDILARCVFGLNTFTLNEKEEKNKEFITYAKRIIKGKDVTQFQYLITTLFPSLLKKAEPYSKKDLDYMRSLTLSQMKNRKAEADTCGDFIDVLNTLQKKKQKIKLIYFTMAAKIHFLMLLSTENWMKQNLNKCHAKENKINTEDFLSADITLDTLVSQVFTLLVANFASITMTLTLVSYHLAANTKMQQRAQEEVKNYFATAENCDDCAASLPFLSNCIKETLRLYPVVVRLERQSNRVWKPQQAPTDPQLSLPADTVVKIPIYAIHHNPTYFKKPEVFDPDRFEPDNDGVPTYPPNSFLPLGLGPRNCFGYNFAFDEMKTILSCMIRDYTFTMRQETKLEQTPGVLYIAESVRIKDLVLGLIPRFPCHS